MISTILWDFNGTVMDDMGASVEAVNAMCSRRGLPRITEEWYTLHLVMPLERFYSSIGFDMEKEVLADVSEEFQQECAKHSRPVFPEVLEALEQFRQKGVRQLLFSSLHQDHLIRQAEERGITHYFEEIVGRKDRSLGGKEQAAAAYLKEHGIDPKTVLVVGDLTTDYDMASFVGCPCALIEKGHQHREILSKTGAYVLRDASEIEEILEELQ
ncbi:MAG: HAD family hydrolase [Clostridia bacterium]|nr:HAD family hydrolase [Clostridia bacterium]